MTITSSDRNLTIADIAIVANGAPVYLSQDAGLLSRIERSRGRPKRRCQR
jgi:hypothetical protein